MAVGIIMGGPALPRSLLVSCSTGRWGNPSAVTLFSLHILGMLVQRGGYGYGRHPIPVTQQPGIGLGSEGSTSPLSLSPFLGMVAVCAPLSSFPTLLDLRENPGTMQFPKVLQNLVPSRASLGSRYPQL